jgi:phage recombination protein Bet
MSKETTTALAETKPKASALSTMAGKFNVEPSALLNTLKETAFKGATDSQMMALCVVANEYGLNPFTKEIYAFPDKAGGIVPVIGVDGWYNLANSNPAFDGCEFDTVRDPKGDLEAITCRIYRKDRARAVEVTEFLSECKRNSPPWNTQPIRMLRHRAFIQCARVAFGLSAMDPEDAERMRERDGQDRAKIEAAKISFAPAIDAAAELIEEGGANE